MTPETNPHDWSPMRRALNALAVIACNATTRVALAKRDPKALEQAERAIAVLEPLLADEAPDPYGHREFSVVQELERALLGLIRQPGMPLLASEPQLQAAQEALRRAEMWRCGWNPFRVTSMRVLAVVKDAVYVRLEPPLARQTSLSDQGCRCAWCEAHKGDPRADLWDVLCVPLRRGKFTHTVHGPDDRKWNDRMFEKGGK